MARATIQRSRGGRYNLNPQLPEGLATRDIFVFNKPKGMNTAARLFDVPLAQSPYMKNWRLDRGTLTHKFGTSKLGPGLSTEILGIIEFTKSDGTKYIVRATLTKYQIYSPGVDTWTDMTGPGFSYPAAANVIFSGWGDQLMAVTLSGALHLLNVSAGTYTAITTTPRAVGSHITTFAGRAIMSQSDAFNRVAWSTKNDNTKWDPSTDIGAGYEDLYSTPGGNSDIVWGVYPISDEQAIIVRSRSIWLMTTTGIADVPFRFSRLFDKIACESPLAISLVPGGLIVPCLDDIYLISPSAIQALSTWIRPTYVDGLFEPSTTSACYDEHRGEWVLSVKEGSVTSFVSVIWRWSFFDQGWSREEFQTYQKYVANARSVTTGTTIDQLTGTIDALSGTIDGLSAGVNPSGILYVSKATSGVQVGYSFVLREDPMVTQDWNTAYDTHVDVSTEIRTGIVSVGGADRLNRDRVNDIQLEYLLSTNTLPMNIDYSVDGGISWTSFSAGNVIPVTTIPDIFRFAGTIETPAATFRFTTTKLGNFRINGVHFMVAQGGRQFP